MLSSTLVISWICWTCCCRPDERLTMVFRTDQVNYPHLTEWWMNFVLSVYHMRSSYAVQPPQRITADRLYTIARLVYSSCDDWEVVFVCLNAAPPNLWSSKIWSSQNDFGWNWRRVRNTTIFVCRSCLRAERLNIFGSLRDFCYKIFLLTFCWHCTAQTLTIYTYS